MAKTYIYKRQGDGRDSWACTETDNEGNTINKYMVYEDPAIKKKTDLSNIDIDSLSSEQISKLKTKLGL